MQSGKNLRILGKRCRLPHVVCRIRRCQILQAEIGEDAEAEARAVRISLEHDDGHAHVERIERRAAARIGKRVERDVDIMILVQVFMRIGTKLDALAVDSHRLQTRECRRASLLARKGGGLQEQARVRDCSEDLRPCRERLVRRLGESIEAAEGHEAFPQAWRSARRRRSRLGRIAEVRMCKHEQFLCKERRFLDARRCAVEPYVADHIVDCGKPRRREIADTRHLHGRRAMGEHGKRRAARMTGEIHEDVYAVLVDAPRRLPRQERRDVSPSVDETHDAAALLILGAVLVAIDLEALSVVMREERLGKAQHDMTAQVGRDIADANLAPLLPQAMKKRRHIAEKLSVSTVRTVCLLLRHAQKMQREEDIAPCHGTEFGSFRRNSRLFIGGCCFLRQSHGTRRLPEKVAELLDVERGNPFLALQERGERLMRREQLPLGEEETRPEERAVDGLRLLLQE